VTKGGAALLFNVGLTGPPASAGIAIRVIGFGSGTAQMNSVLTDATRQGFPEALFSVPGGYARRDFPGLRGR